jgi:hypothetical protein
MKYSMILILLLCTLSLNAALPASDCEGTPQAAVMVLPDPLSRWGKIECTPYGHIITHRHGWIWSNPGGYFPVMIPSQMVRTDPEPLGNQSYFTQIDMDLITGSEADESIKIFEEGFDTSENKPKVYSLKVSSVSGKKLAFKFFDYGDSQWGMWCNKACDPNSRFMLLDMSNKPNK